MKKDKKVKMNFPGKLEHYRIIYSKKTLSYLFYLIAWPCIISGTAQYLLLAILKRFANLTFYTIDPTLFLGSTGFWLLITCFLWSIIASVIRYFFQQSINQPNLQHWIFPLTVLENRDINDKHLRTIIKFTYAKVKFVLYAVACAAFSFYIPILIGLPAQYLPWTLFNAVNTAFHGYICTAWEFNFIFLLGFYLYYCGLRYSKLTSSFRRQLISQSVYHTENPQFNLTPYYDEGLRRFTQKIIKLAKEIDKAENFWYRVNNTVFMGTFLAETLLLYLTFFANTEGAILCCCIFLGLLTIFYGQSINFIPGIYLQHKFDEAVNDTKKWINHSSYLARLRALTVLDYLTERHLFVVFWCVDTTTWNYLKVQAEVAMLLLLLISNSRR
ncbi:uncharacterized protein LOC107365247 isoform X2 [Tetranychus urticae]|uniref:uncharacterized protein LOC107365247 isoform X2 n=1 Tax=Tetranychus urticae TaxID=32264 RepID=UPI000D6443DE|nr:uncharacterized protein LOC107365247 isoform X2 [Tetranychus urticae]